MAYALVIYGVGAVLHGQFKCLCVRNLELWHRVGHDEAYGSVLGKAKEGTEVLHLLLEGDLCIHGIGLFAKAANLQLEHLVLGDGAYLVASLCHAIEGVGTGEVASCHFQVALCVGKAEEIGTAAGRDEFYGLGIVLLCLGVAQGLYALVPLERVMTEEALLVTYAYGHGAEHVGMTAEFAVIVGAGLNEERTSRPTDVLVDAQVEVGTQLALAKIKRTAIALGNLVYLIVDIRRGGQGDTGQIVGTEVAVVPMLGKE